MLNAADKSAGESIADSMRRLNPVQKLTGLCLLSLLMVWFLSACNIDASTPPLPATITTSLSPATNGSPEAEPGVRDRQALISLQKVDAYPLYAMTYKPLVMAATPSNLTELRLELTRSKTSAPDWGCSLFTALADPEARLFGRNFDWRFSPALLLFYYPPEGYSSVSMVDIEYLFDGADLHRLDEMSLMERMPLLDSVQIPFDGMNSSGLVIGMAAVPFSPLPEQTDSATVSSLGIMRQILDQASDVGEALAILSSVNLDWGGGPPLHYLISDRHGKSVLVEFIDGDIVILESGEAWQAATNFLQGSAIKDHSGLCQRYDLLQSTLEQLGGALSTDQAMELLARVAQVGLDSGTQWSVVYNNSLGQVQIVMGRMYENPHTYVLKLQKPE